VKHKIEVSVPESVSLDLSAVSAVGETRLHTTHKYALLVLIIAGRSVYRDASPETVLTRLAGLSRAAAKGALVALQAAGAIQGVFTSAGTCTSLCVPLVEGGGGGVLGGGSSENSGNEPCVEGESFADATEDFHLSPSVIPRGKTKKVTSFSSQEEGRDIGERDIREIVIKRGSMRGREEGRDEEGREEEGPGGGNSSLSYPLTSKVCDGVATGRKQNPLFDAVRDVCHLSNASGSYIGKTIRDLAAEGVSAEDILRWYGEKGWWFTENKKNRPPTLYAIIDTFVRAREWESEKKKKRSPLTFLP